MNFNRHICPPPHRAFPSYQNISFYPFQSIPIPTVSHYSHFSPHTFRCFDHHRNGILYYVPFCVCILSHSRFLSTVLRSILNILKSYKALNVKIRIPTKQSLLLNFYHTCFLTYLSVHQHIVDFGAY